MTESQAQDMLDILGSILDKLRSIDGRLSDIETNTSEVSGGYNLSDIHSKLDDIQSIIPE